MSKQAVVPDLKESESDSRQITSVQGRLAEGVPGLKTPADLEGRNLVVLLGVLSGDIEIRTFASGSTLASFSLRVPERSGKNTSVPVALWDPPFDIGTYGQGDPVDLIGHVVRRFWSGAGGVRRSSVEVVADSLRMVV